MKRFILLALTCSLTALVAFAQLEPIPEDRGVTGLALQLRKLGAGATFLHTTAHPDDEDNGLLVMLSRGRGLRTALSTVTRGDGGQNEIGPELFEAIGILRTEELMAMHRFDGVEQYFTRAYEFGYSFSVEETLEKWGEEDVLEDIVRIIRTVRPDVMVMLPPRGGGGGQHHQTSGLLTAEAFRAAADPNRFPEQIAAGLRPWQPLKLYSRTRMGFGPRRPQLQEDEDVHLVELDTGHYDPILGRSYYQMGLEARSNHKCQGMRQLRAFPGSRQSVWRLEDNVIEVADEETDLFDGVDTGLARLEAFVAGEGERGQFVGLALNALQREVDAATDAFDANEPWKTVPALRRGLDAVRKLRAEIASSDLSESARYELEHRLAPKEHDFETALALAHGIGFDPIADRGEVTRGSKLNVDVRVTNRSPQPIELQSIEIGTPAGWSVAEIKKVGEKDGEDRDAFPDIPASLIDNAALSAPYEVTVAPDAAYDRPYWGRGDPTIDRFELNQPADFGLPWSPPALSATITFRSGNTNVSIERPVQYRYEGRWVGSEKQKIVSVLPLVSVTVAPGVVVFPSGADDKTRPVSVNAVYKGTEAAKGTLQVEVPSGWTVEPSEAELSFERENVAVSVRFRITPPDNIASGTYHVKAVARVNGEEFREGVQTIAYHHIQTRYLYHPAEATVQALDLSIAPVKVGYVVGVGDEIPAAIRQLGAELTFLQTEDLAEGDLSQYDVIMTGVRAYLAREDLRSYNQRLLDYVFEGGTLLVQYNKFEFNAAEWGPYPKKVSRNRVTVEQAPIDILVPEHPVFNTPNRITEDDWGGWVQERGLYFLDPEGDPRYTELLASEDPLEYNAGVKTGMLVEAQYGEGRWIYIGLGFFRQLPAGVPSAYKLFANLLSLPKTSAASGE